MNIAVHMSSLRSAGGADKLMLQMARCMSQRHQVTLLTAGQLTAERVSDLFGLDTDGLRIRSLRDGAGLLVRLLDRFFETRPQGMRYRKVFTSTLISPLTTGYDVFLNGESGDLVRNRARIGLLYVFFPWDQAAMLRARGPLHSLYMAPYRAWHSRTLEPSISSYGKILTLSEYSARHVAARWNRDAELLYPGIDLRNYRPGMKKRIILMVGRFFRSGGHVKRFDMGIETFGRLCSSGLSGWELHIAGYVQDTQFVEDLRRQAGNLPVIFHANAPECDVRALYSTASIYWHCAGFGQDLAAHPQNAEHFGMPTVEAMSAGCVPVVFNAGGQPEIVHDGVHGFLWSSAEALASRSLELAADEPLRRRMAAAAIERSRVFSLDAMRERLETTIHDIDKSASRGGQAAS